MSLARPLALDKESIADYKRIRILEALRKNNWNQRKSAEELGMPLRSLTFNISQYRKQGFRVSK